MHQPTRLHITWQDDNMLHWILTPDPPECSIVKPTAPARQANLAGSSAACGRRAEPALPVREVSQGHDDQHAARLFARERRAVW
jgi:hypothetical protein